MNIWTKVNGKWAVCGPDVKDFATVEVSKKDGTKQTVDLGAVAGTTTTGRFKYAPGHKPPAVNYAFPRETQSDKASATQSNPTGKTKQCWECGGTFDYNMCKQNDGDWSDSYCGC
jgi:hypothetical protein